jgi:sec-independent protein translocase protein TatC
MAAPQDALESGGRMPFTEHLGELRTRLFNSVLGVMVASAITFFFRNELFAIFARPLFVAYSSVAEQAHLPPFQLVYTSPVEVFMAPFKLSLLAAVFVGSPVIFQQVWKFVSPGLYPRERRLALPFIFVSVALFLGGAAFAYFFVLPASYKYFIGISAEPVGAIRHLFGHDIAVNVNQAMKFTPMITMDEYFGLTSMLLLVFGVVFELPMLLAILAMLGIVTAGTLWRFNRIAILVAFVLGAVVTPGDLVVGQIAMGTALTVLYNLSIVVAWAVGRPQRRAAAAAEPTA